MIEEQGQVHSESPEERLAKAFDALDNPELPASEDDEAASEEISEDAGDEIEEESPAPVTVKVKLSDGTEKEITLEEAASGYMQQSDYTRKTQALAEERRALAREHTERIGALHQELSLLEDVFANPVASQQEILQLEMQNPQEAARLKLQNYQQQQLVSQVRAKREAIQQQINQQMLEQAEHFLQEKAPELLEAPAKQAIAGYLQGIGYKPNELNALTDPRALIVADKARKWDELQAKQGEVKAKAAPVIQKTIEAKGKNPMPAKTKEFLSARTKLKQGKASRSEVGTVLSHFYDKR